jgi:hypothetical protein
MKVTREQLAEAVDGMEIIVDLTGGDVVPGTWTGAKLRYPGPFATAVFARLTDQGSEIGSSELAAVFGRCRVEVKVTEATALFADGYPTEESAAKLAAVAEREFAARAAESPAELADEFARSPIASDRELSFLTMAVAALDEMGDFAAARCMTYLSNRYPADD